ncbi:unnamed protein product, partial [Didymodactylos carnosus]
KYYKLIGIYTEYEHLLHDIQENIQFLIKQSEAYSLFDQDEKSMKNLNREWDEFKFFHIIKIFLSNIKHNTDTAKKEMTEICRNYYLNKALRTENFEALYTLRFFINDLCSNLNKKYPELKQRQKDNPIIVSYRGLKLTSYEIYNFKRNIGQMVSTYGFLSTSRSKDVAYSFAKKCSKRLDVEIVMLEIEVNTELITAAFADIAEYSDYPDEEEVLFDLGASFTITNVSYIDNEKIWLVKLIAVPTQELWPAEIYNYLGQTYFQQGDYENSLINYHHAFDEYLNNTVSPNMYQASSITNSVGVIYHQKDNYDEAMKYYTNAYNMRKEILPKDHCQIGQSLNNIGCIYNEKNDYEYIREKNLNFVFQYGEYRDTLLHLIEIYEKKDDNVAKELCMKKLYNLAEKVLSTKTLVDNTKQLSVHEVLAAHSDDDNSLEHLLKMLKIYAKIQPINYEKIAELHKTVSNVYYRKCEYNWSIEHFQKAIVTYETYLSDHYKEIAQCQFNIALIYIEKKHDYDLALNYNLKALQIREMHLPMAHIDIAHSHNNIGSCYYNKIEFDKALEHNIKASEIYEKNLPNNLEDYAQCHCNISSFLLNKGQYNQALVHVIISLNIREKILSDDNINIAFYHHIIGTIYFHKVDYNLSLEHHIKSMKIFEKILPNNHPAIAQIYYTIGECYCKLNDYNLALDYNIKSLKLRENILPSIHIHLAQSLSNIAIIYSKTQNYQKAIEDCTKSLEICNQLVPSETSEIASCLENIGEVYNLQNNRDIALEFYTKSLEMYKRIVIDHSNIERIQSIVNTIRNTKV